MKKIILILLSIFILSCSNNDSPTTPENPSGTEGTILSSYKYNTQSGTEHFFTPSGRYDKINTSGLLQFKYEYDASGKMIQKKEYLTNGSVASTITFFYNATGKIIKTEEQIPGSNLKVWLYTYTANVIVGEYAGTNSNPSTFNGSRVRYTFNNDGLITKYEKYDTDTAGNETIYRYNTFIYDTNKNIISSKHSQGGTHDLPNSNPTTTSSFSYTYDNKVNPLFQIYQNDYLNYIVLQNSNTDFTFPFGTSFRGYSKNNFLNTTYPSDYFFAKYKSEYTYQSNNLPKVASIISISTNTLSSSINYNYIN
jgi:hypothetical protein